MPEERATSAYERMVGPSQPGLGAQSGIQVGQEHQQPNPCSEGSTQSRAETQADPSWAGTGVRPWALQSISHQVELFRPAFSGLLSVRATARTF